MASSQGTQSSKMSKREETLAFIEAYKSLPELCNAESKHYTKKVKRATAYDTLNDSLFLSAIVTRTRRHIALTPQKTDKLDGKPVLCQKTFNSVFRSVFLHRKIAQFNLECIRPFSNVCDLPTGQFYVHSIQDTKHWGKFILREQEKAIFKFNYCFNCTHV
jgi:hypothetical protein